MKKRALFSGVLVLALALAAGAPMLPAQEAPGGRKTLDSLTQTSVIDKLLAIEGSLGPRLKPARYSEDQWINDYEALYRKCVRNGQLSAIPGGGANTTITALTLGIKAADAAMALKAHNVETLSNSAEQIEQLALRLGADRRDLGMVNSLKTYASEGRWRDAFMSLGFLQRSVLTYLTEDPEKAPQATFVIVGGWLQGGRCISSFIDANYTGTISNVMREPRMVDAIKDNLAKLRSPYKDDPMVGKIRVLLPEIRKRVNVGYDVPIKREDVKWLYGAFDSLVVDITGGTTKKAALAK